MIGTVSVGSEEVATYVVIRTDEHARALALGYDPIPDEMTDAEVKQKYGVTVIYEPTDTNAPVN